MREKERDRKRGMKVFSVNDLCRDCHLEVPGIQLLDAVE